VHVLVVYPESSNTWILEYKLLVSIWTLSISSGTSYAQQSYKVSDSFPFKWINKKWKEGFYVTSMATAGSRWAVVMSRNAGFTDQVHELFVLIAHCAQGSHSALYFSSRLTSIVEIFFSRVDIWGEKQIFMNVYLKCWSEHGKIWNWRNHFILQVVELDFLYPSEGIHQRWDNGYRITATAATLDQAAFILSIPRRKPNDETQETLRTSAFPSQHVKVTWQFLLIV
jgi:hypothetical protein